MAPNDLLNLLMAGGTPKTGRQPAAEAGAITSNSSTATSPAAQCNGQDTLSLLFSTARMEQSPLPAGGANSSSDTTKKRVVSPRSNNGHLDLLGLLTTKPTAVPPVASPSHAASKSAASPTTPYDTPSGPVHPSPFSFISPFDSLQAATSKTRSTSAVYPDPVSVIEEHAEPPVPTLRLEDSSIAIRKVEKVPISRFSSELKFTHGRRIACEGLISYSTRAGRIRVIDPVSGARLIKKLHIGLVEDMAMSGVLNGTRRLASCSAGRLSVWQVPASFETDDVPNPVLLDISSSPVSFGQVAFSPTDPRLLLAIDTEGKIYFMTLEGAYEGSTVRSALLNVRNCLSGVVSRLLSHPYRAYVGCRRYFRSLQTDNAS